MTVGERFSDLIQADIDGEISPEDKADLDTFLATSQEGKALHAELKALAESLDAIPELDPPPHLKHVILNMTPVKPAARAGQGFRQRLFSLAALRSAGLFAAGAILALALVDSGRISDRAFDDVTGLVGTVAELDNVGPAYDVAAVDETAVAGTVSLRSSGRLLILDFDLLARDAVEVVARYSDQTIWFNGFAQLESSGASVAAEPGLVRLEMTGKRRCAVFLDNSGKRPAAIAMQFFAGGELIHEAKLEFETKVGD